MVKEILVTKSSGDLVNFSDAKLKASLMRSGATTEQANNILDLVVAQLYPGISTKKIYRLAFDLLKKGPRSIAARYHLKQGIMELGPSGYPFEKFIGAMFERQGYKVQVGVVMEGKCVSHEVDVLAETDTEEIMVECKYHNLPGIFCDVKVPLYIHSRFRDIAHKKEELNLTNGRKHDGWLVTNTRFSTDAIQYGNCAGLKLLGWDYPFKNSLKDIIDRENLYPLTCLTSLTKPEKVELLEMKVVLCKELHEKPILLEKAGIKPSRIAAVLEELEQLCSLANDNGATK